MDQDAESTGPGKTLRLKMDLFEVVAERNGWKSDAAIARALGVPRKHVGLIVKGLKEPTAQFIAAFAAAINADPAVPGFEIVPVSDSTEEIEP